MQNECSFHGKTSPELTILIFTKNIFPPGVFFVGEKNTEFYVINTDMTERKYKRFID